jgi:CBS domain-containing protein
MRAHQIMSKSVITVTPESRIIDAANIMLEKHVSGLPCVGSEKFPRRRSAALKARRRQARVCSWSARAFLQSSNKIARCWAGLLVRTERCC